MRIIGPATATLATVLKNAEPITQERFRAEPLGHLWLEALRYHINPVGVVAQAIKETGGGAFTGKVKWEFNNTCGLKVKYQDLFPETKNDEPLAHQMFPSWQVGARAHVQHLRAYAGWPVDSDDLIVDPRYWWVIGRHSCEDWTDLSEKWAKPGLNYGQEIEALMERLSRNV